MRYRNDFSKSWVKLGYSVGEGEKEEVNDEEYILHHTASVGDLKSGLQEGVSESGGNTEQHDEQINMQMRDYGK
ncbi:hypothetical protein ACS0TY_001703 [Phlomoides rotata]